MKLRLSKSNPSVEYDLEIVSFIQNKLSAMHNTLASQRIETKEEKTILVIENNLNRISELASVLKLHIYTDRE